MSSGLFAKSIRENRVATLGFAAGVFALEVLLAFVLPRLADGIEGTLLRLPFVRVLVSALIGADVSNAGPLLTRVIPWVHPVILATLWAQQIVHATRFPVGDIDRGTIDLWLAMPVSRWRIWIVEGVVFIASGVVVLAALWAGNSLGSAIAGADGFPPGRALVVLANLLLVHTTVGGFAWLISSFSERRGRAMTAAFVAVIASFVLNFLAPFWDAAEAISFLGFLEYYRPLEILRGGDVPLGDFAVLAALSIAFWTTGGILFARRDVHTL